MNRKSLLLRIAIGLLVIAATSLLPIEREEAILNTGVQQANSALSALLDGLPQEGPPIQVRVLDESKAPGLQSIWEESLRRELERSAPRLTQNPEAKALLALTASVEQDQVSVKAVLSGGSTPTIQEEKSARIGDWLSLLPPLVAVILSLAFQQVLLALLAAVWVGIGIIQSLDPFSAGLATVTDVLVPVLSDSFNLKILGFTFALIGMVAVINRMGGTRGLINVMSGFAKDARQTQVATGLMGTAVFFDDYANTVVVGSTVRELSDSQKISREKLAYIVDSTSAPIAGIALVSTWIGYEVGLFTSILPDLASIPGLPKEGYGLFFEALPLRFYCIFALALVFLSAWLRRDMGPMLKAERRARSGGPVVPGDDGEKAPPMPIEKPGAPPRWINAVLPIATVLFGTLGSIAFLGGTQDFSLFSATQWRLAFEGADEHIPTLLVGSSLAGSLLAFLLAFSQRILTPKEAVSAYFSGITHLLPAGAILVLAWAIKDVCGDVGTGNALVTLIGKSLPAVALPLAIFLLSGMVAFFTGTSWGTMALILPVAGPLAASISGEAFIVIACVGAVLDGAIWGDHCSPISDTTVLSSTATGCPHTEHVRTQIPYATLAMGAAGLGGYLAYGFGAAVSVCYAAGIAILIGGLYLFGGDPEKELESSNPT
jgi:Na+/H+ antiporter NhaC